MRRRGRLGCGIATINSAEQAGGQGDKDLRGVGSAWECDQLSVYVQWVDRNSVDCSRYDSGQRLAKVGGRETMESIPCNSVKALA